MKSIWFTALATLVNVNASFDALSKNTEPRLIPPIFALLNDKPSIVLFVSVCVVFANTNVSLSDKEGMFRFVLADNPPATTLYV